MLPARRARWRDLRLWLGLMLIVASMFAGAKVISSGTSTVTLWRAAKDLAIGTVPEVEPVAVSLGGAATAYLAATSIPEGRMRYPIAAGALIPVNAVGAAIPVSTRLVTIPVEPMRMPVGLAAGDVVDVWAAPANPNESSPLAPSPVLRNIRIATVDYEGDGLRGELPVVLDVTDAQVPQLIAAARGAISLVLVPLEAQPVAAGTAP